MAELRLTVEGMSCNHCAARVEDAVSGVEGVDEVHVDLNAKLLTVNGSADRSLVEQAVRDAGYQPVV